MQVKKMTMASRMKVYFRVSLSHSITERWHLVSVLSDRKEKVFKFILIYASTYDFTFSIRQLLKYDCSIFLTIDLSDFIATCLAFNTSVLHQMCLITRSINIYNLTSKYRANFRQRLWTNKAQESNITYYIKPSYYPVETSGVCNQDLKF